MKIDKMSKLYVIFFIILLSVFNLSISMEQSSRANVKDTENRAPFSQIPGEIKHEILSKGVMAIIENNCNSELLGLVKCLARYLLPLKLIDQNFNELVSDYISRDLNEKLEAYRINIDQKDINGNTILMTATESGRKELVKLLISAGARIDEKNNDQYTALILAVINGHKDIVKLLIDAGAKIYAGDDDDIALTYAVIKGHTEIVTLLIEYGAKIYTEKHRGSVALTIASQQGHNIILQLLKNASA